MNITEMYLSYNVYSRPMLPLTAVKGIVIHYVANPGSSAVANRNYFNNLTSTYASSHYIVGLEGEIIACIPEDEIAYHAGDKTYNSTFIGIEVCHPDTTGKFVEPTYSAVVELTADICKRYNLNPQTDVIRHYDVTGKLCPLYYVNNKDAWEQFLSDVEKSMSAEVLPEILPSFGTDVTEIAINGVVTTVEAKLINDFTYVKLRDLISDKIEVGYDGRIAYINTL
ncbi:MAG: hypothetical protein ATN33_03075 [Epulopiscium sp. Nele67-Bin001]|nr:MAG: hypothetical protein BEN18_10995 [Epulopiscium sp. Nuni2H_MBin001]OON90394.1 MAG: hypothetical protein ATN33_03075 [Epulopiscium sp. Nele67-Bin001]